jgi:hypothetical protein
MGRLDGYEDLATKLESEKAKLKEYEDMYDDHRGDLSSGDAADRASAAMALIMARDLRDAQKRLVSDLEDELAKQDENKKPLGLQ